MAYCCMYVCPNLLLVYARSRIQLLCVHHMTYMQDQICTLYIIGILLHVYVCMYQVVFCVHVLTMYFSTGCKCVVYSIVMQGAVGWFLNTCTLE